MKNKGQMKKVLGFEPESNIKMITDVVPIMVGEMLKDTTKEYLLNGNPISWEDLIKEAENYGLDGDFISTSQATKILRENGFTVERNPNYNSSQ